MPFQDIAPAPLANALMSKKDIESMRRGRGDEKYDPSQRSHGKGLWYDEDTQKQTHDQLFDTELEVSEAFQPTRMKFDLGESGIKDVKSDWDVRSGLQADSLKEALTGNPSIHYEELADKIPLVKEYTPGQALAQRVFPQSIAGERLPQRVAQEYLRAGVADLGSDQAAGVRESLPHQDNLKVYEANLVDLVSPYYKNAPGGFGRAAFEAEHAMRNRQHGLTDRFPKWNIDDITDDKKIYTYVPKDGRTVLGGGAAGYYQPQGDYIVMPRKRSQTYSDWYEGPRVRRTFEEMQDYEDSDRWNFYETLLSGTERNPNAKYTRMPNPYNPRVGGWSGEKATLDHELTHSNIGGGKSTYPRKYPDSQTPYKNPYGDDNPKMKKYWDYAATPTELDPRIAEIKRAYTSSTGRHVNTMEEAEKAWYWWMRGGGSKYPYQRDKDVLEQIELDDKLKETMLRRMLELVGAPTMQPGVYA